MDDKSVDLCDSDTVLRQQAYLLFYIRYSDLEAGQRASSSPAPPEARSLLSQWAAGSKQIWEFFGFAVQFLPKSGGVWATFGRFLLKSGHTLNFWSNFTPNLGMLYPFLASFDPNLVAMALAELMELLNWILVMSLGLSQSVSDQVKKAETNRPMSSPVTGQESGCGMDLPTTSSTKMAAPKDSKLAKLKSSLLASAALELNITMSSPPPAMKLVLSAKT
ncbi:hypothetical protein Q9233_008175 [Columba guinea]|nr:hypothetical protein Q9233_008175 [Columba guinea]